MKPLVCSHRGPYLYVDDGDGGLRTKASGGGLAAGLTPLVVESSGCWVAVAVSEEDRRAAVEKPQTPIDVQQVLIDPALHEAFYVEACTESLWFLFHDMDCAELSPNSWDAYRHVNEEMARVAVSADGDFVLVEDFHLLLMGHYLREFGETRQLAYFHHTPWPAPDTFTSLSCYREILQALGHFDSIGFHCHRWAENFVAVAPELGPKVVVSPIPPDTTALRRRAREASDWKDRLIDEANGRKILARIDRIDPTKNIVRGFEAFEFLLTGRPDLVDSVWFAAMGYPSRSNVGRYKNYIDECREAVDRIHKRFGRDVLTWFESDDPMRSAAGMAVADVALVNPVADGLNLVALEFPSVSETGCAVALSKTAGVYEWIAKDVFALDSLSASSTAEAIAQALHATDKEQRQKSIRDFIDSLSVTQWVEDRLKPLG